MEFLELMKGVSYKKAFRKCRKLNATMLYLNFDQKEVLEGNKVWLIEV